MWQRWALRLPIDVQRTHLRPNAQPPPKLPWSLSCLQGRSEEEVETVGALFSDVQRTIDAKQLKPMVRTQYMRTEYQIPFDGTVRIGWVVWYCIQCIQCRGFMLCSAMCACAPSTRIPLMAPPAPSAWVGLRVTCSTAGQLPGALLRNGRSTSLQACAIERVHACTPRRLQPGHQHLHDQGEPRGGAHHRQRRQVSTTRSTGGMW